MRNFLEQFLIYSSSNSGDTPVVKMVMLAKVVQMTLIISNS